MERVPRLAMLVAAGLCFLQAACSSYTGTKLGVKGDTHVAPDGVPFNLVRAEYKLSRTVPSDPDAKPEYTLAVAYEADPTQRYSLRIAPGPFVNSAFTLNLGANGAITGTVTTITEQLTPAITALGTFVTSVIGAKGVHDETSIREDVEAALTEPSCNQASDAVEPDGGTPPTVAEAMVARMAAFKDDAEYQALFHFLTERELQCLKDAYEAFQNTRSDESAKAIEAWQTAVASYKKKHPEDAVYLAKLSDAVENTDADALATLLTVANTSSANGFVAERMDQRVELYAAADNAAAAKVRASAGDSLKFLSTMDSATWRARHLLYLEREFDRLELHKLRSPGVPPDAIDRTLALLETQRAELVGAGVLLHRKRELSRFLETLERKTVDGGTAPATAEYVEARTELDATSAQIATERARVLAAAKPAPKRPLPPLTDVRVERARQSDIDASRKDSWFQTVGASKPDYVLVLEEVQ